MLIEMVKRESLQDDFPNDSELELLFGAAWTLTLSWNEKWNELKYKYRKKS